jgi:zinc protease
MRVAVFPSHRLPIVEITLLLPAGQTAEASDESGMASLTASLLTRGTSSRDAASFEAAIARLGGSISATAGRDVASVDGQFLARDFGAGLELLSDAVLNPVFDDAEVSLEVGRTRRALQRLQFDPAARAEVQLWSLELGAGPYGRSTMGRDSTLLASNSGTVSRFHRAHYRPDHAVLVVAGDVAPDSVIAAVEDRFGSWAGRATPPATAAAPRGPGQARTAIVDVPRLPYTILRLGLLLPGRRSDDDLPLSVALARFAGGFTSWTQVRRVNEALGTTVAGTLSSMRDAGMYSFGAPLLTDSTATAVRRLADELGRFAREFPADSDLDVLRRAALTGYLRQFETLGGTISQWGEAAMLDLPADATRRTVERLGNLGAADVRAASARWLAPESLCVVAAGPAQKLDSQLSWRGAVAVVPEPAPPSHADTVAATPANQAEAKRIVDQALVAHGGVDSLAAIHDSAIEMKINVGPAGMAGDGTVQVVRKDPYRMASHMILKDYEMREVLNGDQGWSTRPKVAGVATADSAHVAALRANYEGDLAHLLLALTRETHRVARGRRTIENKPTDVVDVRSPLGAWSRYYFDATTHLLYGYDEFSGVPGEAATVARRMFGDYRAVAGVQWPYREQRILNGQTVMRTEIQAAHFNIGVLDNEFQKPRVSKE